MILQNPARTEGRKGGWGHAPIKKNWKPQGLLAPILGLWNSWCCFIPYNITGWGSVLCGEVPFLANLGAKWNHHFRPDLFPPSKSHLWKTMVKVLTLHQVSGCNDKYIQLKFSCMAVQQISVMDLQVSSYAFDLCPACP